MYGYVFLLHSVFIIIYYFLSLSITIDIGHSITFYSYLTDLKLLSLEPHGMGSSRWLILRGRSLESPSLQLNTASTSGTTMLEAKMALIGSLELVRAEDSQNIFFLGIRMDSDGLIKI